MDKLERARIARDAAPSPMEQALRDEIAWLQSMVDGSARGGLGAMVRARLAALTAALPAPGDAGEWVMVPRVPSNSAIDAGAGKIGGGSTFDEEDRKDMAAEIYAAMLSAAPSPPVEISQAQAMREALPSVCDGKEQYAFEEWAKSSDFDMTEHPLHYLFLNDSTDAARQAWKAAIEYCRKRAALAVSPPAAARPTPGGPDAS